jgi:hypothetical protein
MTLMAFIVPTGMHAGNSAARRIIPKLLTAGVLIPIRVRQLLHQLTPKPLQSL